MNLVVLYGKMQESGILEFILLICTLTTQSQYLVFCFIPIQNPLWVPSCCGVDGCSILCFLIVGDFLPPQHNPDVDWQGQELGELVLLPPQQRWVVHFHECHSLSFVPHRSSSPHTGLVSPSYMESFFFFFFCFHFLLLELYLIHM